MKLRLMLLDNAGDGAALARQMDRKGRPLLRF